MTHTCENITLPQTSFARSKALFTRNVFKKTARFPLVLCL